MTTYTAEQLDKIANNIVRHYQNIVFSADYINDILACFDEDLRSFHIKKDFNVSDLVDIGWKPTNYLVLNDKLVIKPSTDDIFVIQHLFLDTSKVIYLADFIPEAREKISSKYLHYITRLEDKLGVPFYEILKME